MKKNSLFIIPCLCSILLCSVSLHAQRKGKMMINGQECEYDTLQYRHVAPGATYMLTQFNAVKSGVITNKMRVHLIEVDLTNPYNNVSQYMAKDEYYSITKQIDEVKRLKQKGLKPVATLNGCGWTDAVRTDPPTTVLREMAGTMVSGNEVIYAVSQKELNWYIDALHNTQVGLTSFDGKVTNGSGESVIIGQVNHFRDHAAKEDKLALFCNGIPQTRAVDETIGTDVILTPKNGGKLLVGANEMVVKEVVSGCGHKLTAGEAALSGLGETETFLKTLAAGDEITIDLNYSDKDGNPIQPVELRTNFIDNSILEGENLHSIRKYLAASMIGVSKDGKTVYLANMEMNSNSNAPEACLADLLIAVGAWNAMTLDGGVSAEMTVDGKYVTVNTLTGRYIPSGFVLYSTAPDDTELAALECANLSKVAVNVGESQAISLYGYNQYGEMIKEDATKDANVEYTCTPALGTITDGTFTATKMGIGTINVSIKGKGTVLQIPVNTTGFNPDVNHDGKIDIKDVNAVLIVMMGGDTTGFDQKAADVDGDGDVDVRDMTVIIKLMK